MQQQKQYFSKNAGLDIIRAPYIPKMTPTSSISEIVFPSQIAIRTTKAGLLIEEIARTGPAGPPTDIAIFVDAIPRVPMFPQMNPVMIRSQSA